MREFDDDSSTITQERPPTVDPVIRPSIEEPSRRRLSTRELFSEAKSNRKLVGAVIAIIVLSLIAVLVFRATRKPAAPVHAAVPVTVHTVSESSVRPWSSFSGRLQAVNYAELRPEVSGAIVAVRFEDGQTVKKGDVLFVIDPTPYQAAVSKAEANLASARTNADFAKTELDRAAKLIESQAIAQRVVDERGNASRIAQAAIQSAQADLERARVDLSRAYVKAPFAGRVGRPEVTVGNLVQDGSGAPILTTIVSKGGIYADIDVDEQTYLESIRNNASGRAQERTIPVELTIQGDKEKTYQGSIYSFDNHIDNVSGTIRARAKFANEDGALMPGMFVSVRVGSSGEQKALLVPERAVGTDQNKKFLYVVGADNKVAYHEIGLGKQVGSDRIVLSGLTAGDRVVTDGLQHVRPDVLVAPTEQK